jgi:UV DNA damage repair endonuclease
MKKKFEICFVSNMNIIAILRIVEYVHENEASLFRYESMLFLLIILISDDKEMIPIF